MSPCTSGEPPLIQDHVQVNSCTLCSRLGIRKLILMDNDVVDITNLNRQVLYNKNDVGRRKVDAASDGLKHHLLDTGEKLSCTCSSIGECTGKYSNRAVSL